MKMLRKDFLKVQIFCAITNNLTLLVCSQKTLGITTNLKCFSSCAHLSEFLASFSKSNSWANVPFKSCRNYNINTRRNIFLLEIYSKEYDYILTLRTQRNPKLGCMNLTISSRISSALISPSNRSLRSMYCTCGGQNLTQTFLEELCWTFLTVYPPPKYNANTSGLILRWRKT